MKITDAEHDSRCEQLAEHPAGLRVGVRAARGELLGDPFGELLRQLEEEELAVLLAELRKRGRARRLGAVRRSGPPNGQRDRSGHDRRAAQLPRHAQLP